jgi:hypothetical protein
VTPSHVLGQARCANTDHECRASDYTELLPYKESGRDAEGDRCEKARYVDTAKIDAGISKGQDSKRESDVGC